jgi:flagella basal body P-ring formation protein FlgA
MKYLTQTIFVFTTLLAALASGVVMADKSNVLNIELLRNVHIKKQDVSLADIATISGGEVSLRNAVGEMVVMTSPRAGFNKSISLNQIKALVRKSQILTVNNINWMGVDKVQVHSDGKAYDFSVFSKPAEQYLHEQLSKKYKDIRLFVKKKTREINLPYGVVDLEVRTNSSRISQKMCVWVDVMVDRRFYRSVPVWMDVEIQADVFVARRNIDEKLTVTADDFSIERHNIAKIMAENLRADDFRLPKLTLKSIKQGEILRKSDVIKAPPVIAGRKVNVQIIEGNIKITTQGIASKNAQVGDFIKVKQLKGDQLFKAKVIGKQLVKVI